jgi:hypothetical protein
MSMPMTKLSDVQAQSDEPTPPHVFGDYFKLILKILAGFILFCWTTTSNYLNSLHIDTNTMYPVFGTKEVRTDGAEVGSVKMKPADKQTGFTKLENFGYQPGRHFISEQLLSRKSDNPSNPYATWFDPGPINMSKKEEVIDKIGPRWWLERTQQSCYQLGGLILHSVFNFFNGHVQSLGKTSESDSLIVKLFLFIKWFIFGLLSNILFACFLALVFLIWIPGFIGGVTAFMPRTYFIPSIGIQLIMQAVVMFCSFVLTCVASFVLAVPVLYSLGHLLYMLFFKQLNDDPARFGDELLKRMKQLVAIYVVVALVAAFASNHLPDETKKTIGTVFTVIMIYMVYNQFMSKSKSSP